MSDLLPGENVFQKTEFKVGDDVVVGYGPTRIGSHHKLQVAKVFKKYVELSDGSKWAQNGLPWGMKPNYVSRDRKRLEHWSEAHEKTNLRNSVSYSFDKQKDNLTLEQLRQIWLIIGPEVKDD